MAKFQLGDRVSWSTRGYDATVIGVPKDPGSEIVLLGWVKDAPPHWNWEIKRNQHLLQSEPSEIIANINQYNLAYWVEISEIVLVDRQEAKSTVKAQSGPVQCKRCKNRDFPFAEPNQADGSFLCWSCQHYPFYK